MLSGCAFDAPWPSFTNFHELPGRGSWRRRGRGRAGRPWWSFDRVRGGIYGAVGGRDGQATFPGEKLCRAGDDHTGRERLVTPWLSFANLPAAAPGAAVENVRGRPWRSFGRIGGGGEGGGLYRAGDDRDRRATLQRQGQ